ncbi:MAG: hypothetical protein HRT61_07110 [Ekhidna sp.]|nr:hypothetical protein [Ekhidna sp.]
MIHTIFGVMIALFVLTQAVLVHEQVEDRTEQSDTENEGQQQISKAAVSHSSSLQLNLDYQSYLLSEVFYQESIDEEAPISYKIASTFEKALRVIFRQIISPNAP